MSVFLDTSVLLKLYLPETDSAAYEARIDQVGGLIVISMLAHVEFASAALKKVRVGTISLEDAQLAISDFTEDGALYQWVRLTDDLVVDAQHLINRHYLAGLRTLDALQLAAALTVRKEVQLFLTADARLEAIFAQEGLPVR